MKVRSIFLCALLSLTGASLVTVQGQDADDLQIRALDQIVLTNGNRFEGRILAELNDLIQFETEAGKVTFPRTDVKQILYRNPPEKVYETKLRREFDGSSFDSQFEIGRWCCDPGVGLIENAILHLEAAVKIDPTRRESYLVLLPLYQSNTTLDDPTQQLLEVSQCQTLLTAVRARVDIDGIDELAVSSLIRIGELEAAVLLLTQLTDGPVTDPDVAMGLRKLVVLLDSMGRSEESRDAAMRLRSGGGGSDAEVLQREIRWAVLDYAAGVLDSRNSIEQMVDDLIAGGTISGEAYLNRGTARLLDGDLADAESDFKKAFRAGSVDAVAATTFALSFARQGYFEKALDLLASASAGTQVEVDWRLVEAYVLESQGETEAALELYQEASLQDEVPWQARLLSIEAKRRADPQWDPTADVQKVLRAELLTPAAFAECSLVLGDHALSQGKHAEARRWFEYSIASGLDSPDVMLRLALAQRGPGGDPERAREALERVTFEQPRSPDGWNVLAELRHSSGDLAAARSALEQTLSLYPEKMRESWDPEAPAPLRWAMRALRRIDRAMVEEYWFDDFEREADSSLQNNWREEEAYGISVSIRDGAALLDGVQKHQPDRLTTMKREILTPRLTGLRSTMRLLVSGPGTRIAFRVEDQSGGGVVYFRDPDGMLGFAVLGGKELEMVRSDDPEMAEEYDLIASEWPDDDRAHQLEIVFSSDGKEGAELWFDGVRMARGISYRPARKSGLTAGFSGQAPLDEGYKLAVEEFEVFRRKAKVVREREF